jgi:hypothetical protein
MILSDHEFRATVRFWLGLPASVTLPSHCSCGAAYADDVTHAHSCHALRGRSVRFRHDSIVRLIAAIVRERGGMASVEPYDTQALHGIRPDAELLLGHPVYVDVSVTHPLAPSIRSVARPAEARERHKIARYRPMSEAEGVAFQPFVLESYGYIPEQSMALIRYLMHGPAPSTFLTYTKVMQMISVCLQRGNARIATQGEFRARAACPRHSAARTASVLGSGA